MEKQLLIDETGEEIHLDEDEEESVATNGITCDHENADEDEDVEIEEIDEDDDDDDDDDDDYCSDRTSTTSTSSTSRLQHQHHHNHDHQKHQQQRPIQYARRTPSQILPSLATQENTTRVCDCCYCEVFGHGVPPVAPTSRNYAEMRERLRQRLSKKRRAEECDKTCQDGAKDDSSNDKGGGTTGVNDQNSLNSTNKSNSRVVDQRNLDELLEFINGTRQKDQDKSSNKKKDNKNGNKNSARGKSNSISNVTSKTPKTSQQNSSKNHTINSQINSPGGDTKGHHCGSSTNKKQTNCANTASSSKNQTGVSFKSISSSNKEFAKLSSSRENRRSSVNSNDNSSCSTTKSPTQTSSDSEARNPILEDRTKNYVNDKMFKEIEIELDDGYDEYSLSRPDDVFMPKRDIDLNDNDLDELERELEAFKRFCFDSMPLVKKERVRLELKDCSFLHNPVERFKNGSVIN